MKKILIILCMVTLIFISGCENKDNNQVDDEPEKKLDIYLFHWSECSHCKEEKAWLETIKETNDINVIYYEVTEYSNLVSDVRKVLGITDEYVPLTIIGTDYIVGFGGVTKTKIMNLIDKYSETDHCDIVKSIISELDTADCYTKNSLID